MTEILLREDTGAIATLTLNRPEKLNVLSEELMTAVQDTLDAISVDPAIRVTVAAPRKYPISPWSNPHSASQTGQ